MEESGSMILYFWRSLLYIEPLCKIASQWILIQCWFTPLLLCTLPPFPPWWASLVSLICCHPSTCLSGLFFSSWHSLLLGFPLRVLCLFEFLSSSKCNYRTLVDPNAQVAACSWISCQFSGTSTWKFSKSVHGLTSQVPLSLSVEGHKSTLPRIVSTW